MRIKDSSGGYVLIMSSLIISFTLLTLVITVSFENFERLIKIFEREDKEISYNLALSCVDQVILRIVQNPSWQPKTEGFEILLENRPCLISKIEKNGKEVFVNAGAQVNKSFTFLEAIFDKEKFEIVSLKEV